MPGQIYLCACGFFQNDIAFGIVFQHAGALYYVVLFMGGVNQLGLKRISRIKHHDFKRAALNFKAGIIKLCFAASVRKGAFQCTFTIHYAAKGCVFRFYKIKSRVV